MARALRKEINRRKGYQAFLTRDGDYYVSLRRRTELARQHHADYFISIHTNAHRDRRVHGSELYFLSLGGASDEGAMDVAQRENAADRIGGVPEESKDVIELILMDLMKTADLESSSNLANTIITQVKQEKTLKVRGVKQAGFDVLKTAGMPSILIEVAFISCKRDAKLLKSERFQRRFAKLVTDGLIEYVERERVAGR